MKFRKSATTFVSRNVKIEDSSYGCSRAATNFSGVVHLWPVVLLAVTPDHLAPTIKDQVAATLKEAH
jgi:hypothetical protein